MTMTNLDYESVAAIAHEANRILCRVHGDHSQPEWEDAPDWQYESALDGVQFHLDNPNAGPEASHENWMAVKKATGWTYGEVKDPEAKTHPCMVPFDQLPLDQQAKDHLFRAIVHALAPFIEDVGFDEEPVKESAGEPAMGVFGLGDALDTDVDIEASKVSLIITEVTALHARVLCLETVLEFIKDMEGQEGMTDAIFAEKTLALIHALGDT